MATEMLPGEESSVRESVMPFAPPLGHAELPAIGGRIGSEHADFCVDEIPLYAACGEGQHHYLRLEKRGLTTPQLIERVARASGIDFREIGSAGLKDKHAVTSQWLSVPTTAKEPPEAWALGDGVRLLEATRHDNKLRTGHLAGNRFAIRLVGAESDVALLTERAVALSLALTQAGLLNFFGAQRFGIGGQNLARALSWVRRGARGKNRFESKLFPSVIQSEVFNRYLALRAERGLGQLLAGEVVRLEGSGASFLVTDRDKEQPRLAQGDIHLLGPMFGPKMKPTEADAAEVERAALAAAGVDDDLVRRLERLAPGTRRDLVVPVAGLAFSVEGPGQGVLSFSLPAGSYATQLVREFTRQGFFEDLRSLLDG